MLVKDLRLDIIYSSKECYCFLSTHSVTSRNVAMNWDSICEGPLSCKIKESAGFQIAQKKEFFITGIFI